MRDAAFIYGDEVSRHVLREDHPMRPSRLRYTYELLQAYGAFAGSAPVLPRMATEEELQRHHTQEYVEAVRSISRGEGKHVPERYNFSEGGDNPPYRGMYEAAALSAGGSLVAAELVADGKARVAFNPSGGLHHAARGHASGFCIFNDAVLAIEYLRRRGMRVAYVDIDCHHGDGVQEAFYETDEVLTVSVHESGRWLFPGTGEVAEMGWGRGRGFAVNVPLGPYTGDALYERVFAEGVLPVVQAFKPDVIVGQLGMDTHFNDPLTHMALTVEGHARVVRTLHGLTPQWVALGGGGYDMSAVARGWTLDDGIMLGREWPDAIPAGYREEYGLERLRDGGTPQGKVGTEAPAERVAAETLEELRRTVFPLHGVR